MDVSNKIKATFLLKGINPYTLFQLYLDGQFEQRDIPENTNEKVVIPVTPVPTISSNRNSEKYSYIDQTNTRQTVITLNHGQFTSNIPLGTVRGCGWCHDTFTFEHIHISIKYQYSIDTKESTSHGIGIYCSFECAYAAYATKSYGPPLSRNGLYNESECILRYLFSRMHPGKKLVKAPDWDLFNINGGPLSVEEFRDNRHTYQQLPNLILRPVKTEYQVAPS